MFVLELLIGLAIAVCVLPVVFVLLWLVILLVFSLWAALLEAIRVFARKVSFWHIWR
jgi:hypothetical protein